MKIKSRSNRRSFLFLVFSGIVILLCSFALLSDKKNKPPLFFQNSSQNPYETPTVIEANKINYKNLIDTEKGLLYKDNDLSVYLITNTGMPKILYLYKKDIRGRKTTDNFFLHVYLKNNAPLNASSNFVNLDFFQKPQHLDLNGEKYFSFIKTFQSDSYLGLFINPNNIKYINTGRFHPKQGRSLDLKKIELPSNIPEFKTSLPSVTLSVE